VRSWGWITIVVAIALGVYWVYGNEAGPDGIVVITTNVVHGQSWSLADATALA
jgi:hypothetical protein